MSYPPMGHPAGPIPPMPRRLINKKLVWVAAILMVLSPILFCGGFLLALSPLMNADGFVPTDGTPTTMTVPANEERAVFVDPMHPATCTVTDGTGERDQSPVGGDFTFNDYQADTEFNTGDGHLTVTCQGVSADSRVRVGQVPDGGTFVVTLLLSFGIPGLMFILGLVLLVVGLVRRKPVAHG